MLYQKETRILVCIFLQDIHFCYVNPKLFELICFWISLVLRSSWKHDIHVRFFDLFYYDSKFLKFDLWHRPITIFGCQYFVYHTWFFRRWFITFFRCRESVLAVRWQTPDWRLISGRRDILLLLFDIAKRPTGKLRVQSTRGQADSRESSKVSHGEFFRGSVLRTLLINEAWFIYDKSKVWEWVWVLERLNEKNGKFWHLKKRWFRILILRALIPDQLTELIHAWYSCERTKTTRSAGWRNERVEHELSSKYGLSIKYEDFVALPVIWILNIVNHGFSYKVVSK